MAWSGRWGQPASERKRGGDAIGGRSEGESDLIRSDWAATIPSGRGYVSGLNKTFPIFQKQAGKQIKGK